MSAIKGVMATGTGRLARYWTPAAGAAKVRRLLQLAVDTAAARPERRAGGLTPDNNAGRSGSMLQARKIGGMCVSAMTN